MTKLETYNKLLETSAKLYTVMEESPELMQQLLTAWRDINWTAIRIGQEIINETK